jgi:photosystem II stability/assembly factor-like uncharacterized protein
MASYVQNTSFAFGSGCFTNVLRVFYIFLPLKVFPAADAGYLYFIISLNKFLAMNFYILAFLLLFAVSSSSLRPDSRPKQKTGTAGPAKIVFKSTDGGQTWQDISKGLPENLRKDGIRGDSIFANDKGLFLRVGNELYHSTPNASAPYWTKEISSAAHTRVAPGTSGIFANNYWGVMVKKANGTNVWVPIFDDSSEPRIRNVSETAGGTIFISTDRGIFKTADSGKTWKQVYAGGWAGHLDESNGVLVATSKRSIIRSTDNGESWAPAISEEEFTFDLKPIKGGFVAITATSESGNRRLSTSYDGGKTWQSIHSGLDKGVSDSIWRTWNDRPFLQAFQTSITQIGENFLCIHPHGIFKSTDKGKTWKLLLPAVDGKVFNLFGSGNVIYAIPSKGGC